jgi:hypothetical protein
VAVTLITPTAYSRHRGCDEKAVRKAILAGRISTINGMIDPAVADIQWAQNTRARVDRRSKAPAAGDATQPPAHAVDAPTQPAGPAGTADPGYADARARRERAEAEEAEIRVARSSGRALDRERAERGAFDAFRELRDAAFAACKSQARRVHGLTEMREIELALEEELREAFTGWEDRMQAKLSQAAATS